MPSSEPDSTALLKTFEIKLENENATQLFAQDVALIVKIGDCITLSGDLGAGKTTFARALIRAMAGDKTLEVPSPTFTLVQNYELRVPLAHLDLYRLSSPDELYELGLDDILRDGAALIEWPEMGDGELPENCIEIKISHDETVSDQRLMSILAPEEFITRLNRSVEIRDFLNQQGFVGATRSFMFGDASTRAYERMSDVNDQDDNPLILMNSPKMADGPIISDGKPYSQLAHLAETVTPFVAIAKYLKSIGLNAPQIPYYDLENGILLVEDLGAQGVLDENGEPIAERYMAAIEVLAHLHEQDLPSDIDVENNIHKIPAYDQNVMQMEVDLIPQWYLPAYLPDMDVKDFAQNYKKTWQDLFALLIEAEKALVLRDYHSPNIIWCPDKNRIEKIGIIDFQDALIGPAAYDVASLVQDARVTIDDKLQDQLLNHYQKCRRAKDGMFDLQHFQQSYAIMAAQRACKVLGIFVRLNVRDSKPHYLDHLPRIKTYLEQATRHSCLTGLRQLLIKAEIIAE